MPVLHPRRPRAAGVAAATTVGLALAMAAAPPARAVDTSSAVIINEVYGGGGNSGALYKRDFIELVNTGSTAVDLSAWSVQYASSSGTSWARTPLTGSIAAGGYYLVAEAAGTGGTQDLPAPDVTGSIAMSGSAGKVALTNTAAAPTGSTGANVVDFVGYGAANDAAGGSANTAPALTNTTSAQRTNSPSVVNTGNNKNDFFAADPPTPKAVNGNGTTTPPGGGDTTPGPDTIQDVQGSGFVSTKAGSSVSKVPGIVTATKSNGFWFQQPTRDSSKPAASSGLFVFTSTAPSVSVGDSVLVSGAVSEFYPGGQSTGALSITQISGPTVVAVATGQALPAALVLTPSVVPAVYAATPTSGSDINSITTVDPGRSVQEFYEAHEGEVAAVTDVRTVSRRTDFNEVFVTVKPGEQKTPRGGTYLPSYAAQPSGRIKIEPVATTLPAYDVGDMIAGTTAGPIDWDQFGGYTIAATQVGSRTDNDLQPTVATAQTAGQLAVATYNVENLSPKDAQSKFDRLAAGIVDNLSSPDVVTLEEIQDNDGPTNSSTVDAGDTLAQLADAVVAAGGPTYRYTEINPVDDQDGGQPGGNIRVAFFYNPERVSFTPRAASGNPSTTAVTVSTANDGTAVLSSNPGRVDPTNSAWSSSRKPLAAEFVFGGKKVIVVANHFNSKGGDQSADGRIQPPVRSSETQRTAQATVLNGFVDDVLAADDNANVVLAGDFNDYQFSAPITTLTDNGATLTDLINTLPANEQYTYVFNGVSQVLDHIFVTNNLATSATQYEVVHLNAEFADQASDHDPQVVRITPRATNPNTTVQLLNINDFHGRIDTNTVKFAGTVEQQRALVGDANSVFLSAGDNVGASLFASASQNDNPTIDVLNALQLQASAVGNHEFDKGFSDLTDHIIPRADWTYLGANVYEKGTQTPALPEYRIVTVGGLKVGVIGVVTQQTPSLVSPGGISDLDFGDPVAAVNRVAGELTDGDAGNGEADLLVAEYHEGAPDSESDVNTLEQEEANSPVFASIVKDTSAKVAAIFTGHTHKTYTFDAPVPGDTTGRTRPILQTGEYGNNIGNITLTVNKRTKQVSAYTQSIVARTTASDDSLVAAYPRVAQVKQITDAALAKAKEEGQKPVGSLTADITTAYANGSRDDRGSESTLGNLVANALRSELSPSTYGAADVGVVNPGGLRADLLYADTKDANGVSTGGGDGVITYAEANAVLPFGNRLFTLTLTGQQFRQVLEQQYQPSGASRPFLDLGLSSNVSYTYDPTKAAGSRITTVLVNGQVLGATETIRVGTFSFLAEGGDNFTAFKSGTDVQDSGIIDREAWIDYIGKQSPLSPNFTKRGVVVNNEPSTGSAGVALPEFTVSKLNLTSLGSPSNTTLAAQMDGVDLGSFPVTGGSATVNVTLPTTSAGNETLVLTASPTGTVVRIPVAVQGAGTLVVQNGRRFVAGDTVRMLVRGWNPAERVNIALDGSVATSVVTNANGVGRVDLTLPGTIEQGPHTLQAQSDTRGSRSTVTTITVIAKPFQAGSMKAYRSSVPQGGNVTLALRRWAPNVTATFTLDDGTALGSVTTDDKGAAGKVVSIPRTTSTGTHQITATAPDGSSVSVNVEVTAR